MRGVEVTRQIRLSLTAEDWELYTVSMPGCEEAARKINACIEGLFNSGADYKTLYEASWALMKEYRDLGATDSEPMRKLDQLLDLLYPDVY